MSNSKRICICGRDRGKEPVVITITTCSGKHGIKTEGPVNRISPRSTSLSLPVSEQQAGDPRHGKGHQNDQQNLDASESEKDYHNGKSSDSSQEPQGDSGEDSILPIIIEEPRSEALNSEKEIYQDATVEKLVEPETGIEGYPNETKEPTAVVNTNDQSLTVFYKDYEPQEASEDIEYSQKSPETTSTKEKAATVFLMTETAVNTLPFLDRFFWPKDKTKSFNSDPKQGNSDCCLDLLLYERHTFNCRHKLKLVNMENSFSDGNYIVTNSGRITLPTDAAVLVEFSRSGIIKSCTFENGNSNIEKNRYKMIMKTIQTYFKSNHFLNENGMVKQQKYIADSADKNVEELFVRKYSNDCALQTGHSYLLNLKSAKWYDGFLMCLGLKREGDIQEAAYCRDELLANTDSSDLVTRYLRI
ncbi:hypothetical protein ABEB36_002122 [Hypothenemus hampei]|uniref:Uncharacterized protein n=1 Tax=Hypothenemus hampei TaxID=57062 RepID=A0ABD1F773_HYPHA